MQDSLLDNFAPLWVRRSLFGHLTSIGKTRPLRSPAFYLLAVANLEKSLGRTIQHFFLSPHAIGTDLSKLAAQNYTRAPFYTSMRIWIPPSEIVEEKEEKPFYKSASLLDSDMGDIGKIRPFAKAYASLGVVLMLCVYMNYSQLTQSRVVERLLGQHSELKQFAALASSLVFWSALAKSNHKEGSGSVDVLLLLRERYETLFRMLTTSYEAEGDVEQLDACFSLDVNMELREQLRILSISTGSVKHCSSHADILYLTSTLRSIAFYLLRNVLSSQPCLYSALRQHSTAYDNFMHGHFGTMLPPRIYLPVTPSVFMTHATSDSMFSPMMTLPHSISRLMGEHIADHYSLSAKTTPAFLKEAVVRVLKPLLGAKTAFNVPYTSAMFWRELQLLQNFYAELLRSGAHSELADAERLLVEPDLVRYLFCFRVYGPRHEKTRSQWGRVCAETQNLFLLLSIAFASRLRFAVLPLEHEAKVNNGVSTFMKMRDFLGEPDPKAGIQDPWYTASAMESIPMGGDVLVYCPRCPRVASLVFSPMSVLGASGHELAFPAAAVVSSLAPSSSSSSSSSKTAFPGRNLKGTDARLDLVGLLRGLTERRAEEGDPDSPEKRAAMVSKVAYEHLYCSSKRRNKRGSNALCVESPLCVVNLSGAIAYVDTEAFLLCQNPECGVITKLSDVNKIGVYVERLYCAACTKRLVLGIAVCHNPVCAEGEMPPDVSHESVKRRRLYCDNCTHRVETADWYRCKRKGCRERAALYSPSDVRPKSLFCSDACERDALKHEENQ